MSPVIGAVVVALVLILFDLLDAGLSVSVVDETASFVLAAGADGSNQSCRVKVAGTELGHEGLKLIWVHPLIVAHTKSPL